MTRPVGLACIVVLLASLLFLVLPGQTHWQRVLQDAGHGPVFAAVAFVLMAMQSGSEDVRPGRRQYLTAFLVAIALGVLTEWAQYFIPNRDVSALDVFHDAAGAIVGLALFALAERTAGDPSAGVARATAWAALLAGLLILAWAPLQCARAYADRYRAFPTLAPLGLAGDAVFLAARDATLTPARVPEPLGRPGAQPGLELGFAAGSRPSLEWVEPPRDWRGYRVLSLDLANPGDQPLSLILRILDAGHDWSSEDRLNLPLVVPARGRVTVNVATAAIRSAPAARAMDMGAIANVLLYAPQPVQAGSLYVARVWLH